MRTLLFLLLALGAHAQSLFEMDQIKLNEKREDVIAYVKTKKGNSYTNKATWHDEIITKSKDEKGRPIANILWIDKDYHFKNGLCDSVVFHTFNGTNFKEVDLINTLISKYKFVRKDSIWLTKPGEYERSKRYRLDNIYYADKFYAIHTIAVQNGLRVFYLRFVPKQKV